MGLLPCEETLARPPEVRKTSQAPSGDQAIAPPSQFEIATGGPPVVATVHSLPSATYAMRLLSGEGATATMSAASNCAILRTWPAGSSRARRSHWPRPPVLRRNTKVRPFGVQRPELPSTAKTGREVDDGAT